MFQFGATRLKLSHASVYSVHSVYFAFSAYFTLLLCLSPLHADWPEFRGPNGNGISDARNLPVKWSASKNVKWRMPIAGEGWSSPVLAGGRIYLTSGIKKGDSVSFYVHCLKEDTGRAVWKKLIFTETESPTKHKKNSHASPTPILIHDQDHTKGRLFVHFGPTGSACLDLAGKVIWRNNEFKYPPVHGAGGSPILTDSKMIFSCDAAKDPFVLALNRTDGKIAWRKKRETKPARPFSFCTPLLIDVNGSKQVILTGSDATFSYHPETGDTLWRVDNPKGYSVVPRPVYAHGLVYVCTGFGRKDIKVIDPTGNGNVTKTHVRWAFNKKGVPKTPSPLVVGKELYMVDDKGVASCIDALSGKLIWQKRIPGNGYSASPIYAEGKVYFQSEDGAGVVIKAGRTYAQLAVNQLGASTLASYAAKDGKLFIRTDEHLYCISN